MRRRGGVLCIWRTDFQVCVSVYDDDGHARSLCCGHHYGDAHRLAQILVLMRKVLSTPPVAAGLIAARPVISQQV